MPIQISAAIQMSDPISNSFKNSINEIVLLCSLQSFLTLYVASAPTLFSALAFIPMFVPAKWLAESSARIVGLICLLLWDLSLIQLAKHSFLVERTVCDASPMLAFTLIGLRSSKLEMILVTVAAVLHRACWQQINPAAADAVLLLVDAGFGFTVAFALSNVESRCQSASKPINLAERTCATRDFGRSAVAPSAAEATTAAVAASQPEQSFRPHSRPKPRQLHILTDFPGRLSIPPNPLSTPLTACSTVSDHFWELLNPLSPARAMLAAHDLTDTHASLPIFQFESLVEGHPLLVMAFHLFERDGLVETFSIDREVLVKSILLVEEGYRSDVPFHNALHAADVLHATALLASMIVPNLAPYQLLALYISALIHDHGHPGLTNTFLTSTSDPLALLYNDRSVLESHHCASGWDALVIRGGMLDFLDEPTKRTVRGLVVDMVMATDLSGHSKLLESFVVASQNVTCAANPSTADMELVMKMILKCADVSNPTRPWDVCYTWTRRLLTEWSRQGDLERHLGLPVSRFMDRRTISLELPQCQLGFIDFIVRPSLSALGTWVGAQAATGSSRTDGIQSLLARLEENRAEWMRLDDAGDGCVDVLLEDPLAFEADSSAPVKYAVTASGGLRQRNAPAAAAAEAAAHLSSNEPKAMLLPNRVFSRGLFADSFADVVPSSA